MPSTPGSGRGSQLPLPQAPKLDRYGLHAYECECGRCALGYRPTPREREAARSTWERAEAKRKAEAERAAKGLPKAEKVKRRVAAFRQEEKFTDEVIRKLNEPVERPATPDELAELRRQYPNLDRRRRT